MKLFCVPLVVALMILTGSVWAAEQADPASLGFIKGYSWGWVGRRGEYASPAAAESIQKLGNTGANWLCLAFAPDMETYDTPEIRFSDANPNMATDDEIRQAIDLARENGMEVILKPVVNCQDGTWRAWIRFFRPVTDEERAAGTTGELDPWGETPKMREGEVQDTKKWDAWWEDYTNYQVHYAKLAEEKKVPALCLGCEMNSTEAFEDKWRHLIAEVRKVYGGLLTYDVNHGGEDNVKWFDAVDFISISAYHPIPPVAGETPDEAAGRTTTVEEIKAGMVPIRDRMRAISAKWHKPILFIETGVTSVRGCAHTPWAHIDETVDRPTDEQEQANYYQAQFETYWDEPWFMGWCWWDWPARLYDESAAATDRSFCVYGKQAESILREWYAKPREAAKSE
jgi:Glycoside Hydrolase Family 113